MLILAAAVASDVPICPDRPGKANAVCTVPKGHFQLELSLIDWTRTRADRETDKLLTLGSPVVKYGISDRSDLQVGFTPYVRVKSTGAASQSGIGDVTIRYKQRLTADKAPVEFALIPFVKLPTAGHDVGNGKVEGGLATSASFDVGGGVSAAVGPELDLQADDDGHGLHVALVNLVSLSAPVTSRLTLSGELWSNFNFDPAGTAKQASADAAVAYLLSNRVQLDAGANAGLTRDTPDLELYAGVSMRF